MNTRLARPMLLVALAAPMLLAAFSAQAHAHLVEAVPAENASVASTRALQLQFSEKLEPKFSGLELTKAGGAAVPVVSKAAGKTIRATAKAALAPGDYRVIWRVVSTDGHRMKGHYDFTVK